ncbi:SET domain-containing protein [Thelephora ganbajun]|uniref:SET domain-containing protein n=1 Tax=Thelephora ganbajun TaxID=370292 RepID=A0ACB6ZVD8_THEGA|nr:SET domain-containing protein [Thelephora ganbajun]
MKQDSRVLTSTSSGVTINDLIPSSTYCCLSNLPTGLLDYLNDLPDSIRKSLVFRQIFESVIAESTAQDEPGAPPIIVINEIDDEPTPPWEFFYSNKLWYHKDVPPPDYNKLVGCDCIGECNPTSTTCVCLRRQKNLWPDGMQSGFGFSYDENGILKNWDETIVECNDLCQCMGKCRNRVVQQGRKVQVNIVKTEEKGWGIFAGERMEAGTFLGIYSGELITEAIGESRRYMLYNEYGRTYLFDLQGNNYVVDAFHVGNFTRFLNHSCAPNCWMKNVVINEHTKRKCVLALFTLEPVEENQELHFSYFGSLDDVRVCTSIIPRGRIEVREDIVNGKCYCGAPNCIGTLFPHIIRDNQDSGDEGGDEAEVLDGERHNEGGEEMGGEGDRMADEGRETGAGNDMQMDT